jgi:hypothetical protein
LLSPPLFFDAPIRVSFLVPTKSYIWGYITGITPAYSNGVTMKKTILLIGLIGLLIGCTHTTTLEEIFAEYDEFISTRSSCVVTSDCRGIRAINGADRCLDYVNRIHLDDIQDKKNQLEHEIILTYGWAYDIWYCEWDSSCIDSRCVEKPYPTGSGTRHPPKPLTTISPPISAPEKTDDWCIRYPVSFGC